jgi:hypothetical protein
MTLTGECPRPLLREINGKAQAPKVLGRESQAEQKKPLLRVVPKSEGLMESVTNPVKGMDFFGEGPLRKELTDSITQDRVDNEGKEQKRRSVDELRKDPKYMEWAQERSCWI